MLDYPNMSSCWLSNNNICLLTPMKTCDLNTCSWHWLVLITISLTLNYTLKQRLVCISFTLMQLLAATWVLSPVQSNWSEGNATEFEQSAHNTSGVNSKMPLFFLLSVPPAGFPSLTFKVDTVISTVPKGVGETNYSDYSQLSPIISSMWCHCIVDGVFGRGTIHADTVKPNQSGCVSWLTKTMQINAVLQSQ